MIVSLCRLRPWRHAASWACLVLMMVCVAAQRPAAAADFNVATDGPRLEAEGLDADEICVRLLMLNDAMADVAADRLDVQPLVRVVDRLDPPAVDAHAVHGCRAPPVLFAS
jgi:hypothetical protein